MLPVAVWLTVAPALAYRVAVEGVQQIAECGAGCLPIARWLHLHLTGQTVHEAALLAWMDAAWTALEGILLLTGRSWGQWMVVWGLALLLPFEAWSVWQRPGPVPSILLAANALIVIYLVRTSRHNSRPLHPAADE
jgi:uncharacterized membrane protein (DUF2068 family)